jgi:hypothetical protein
MCRANKMLAAVLLAGAGTAQRTAQPTAPMTIHLILDNDGTHTYSAVETFTEHPRKALEVGKAAFKVAFAKSWVMLQRSRFIQFIKWSRVPFVDADWPQRLRDACGKKTLYMAIHRAYELLSGIITRHFRQSDCSGSTRVQSRFVLDIVTFANELWQSYRNLLRSVCSAKTSVGKH